MASWGGWFCRGSKRDRSVPGGVRINRSLSEKRGANFSGIELQVPAFTPNQGGTPPLWTTTTSPLNDPMKHLLIRRTGHALLVLATLAADIAYAAANPSCDTGTGYYK